MADPEPVGFGDDERTRALRAAQPFLPGDGVEVEPIRVDRNCAHRLRAVDEDRDAGRSPQLVHGKHGAGRPEDVRDRDQARARGDRRCDVLRIRLHDHDPRTRGVQRAEQPEVLVGRRDQLVFGAEPETCKHDVAAVRRRRRQRDVLGAHPHERRKLGPQLLAHLEETHEPRVAPTPFADADLVLLAHRVDRRASERADAPRLEVGVALEHRELRACLLVRHAPDSDLTFPPTCASSSPTHPRTRRHTTAPSAPHSREPERTWSS